MSVDTCARFRMLLTTPASGRLRALGRHLRRRVVQRSELSTQHSPARQHAAAESRFLRPPADSCRLK